VRCMLYSESTGLDFLSGRLIWGRLDKRLRESKVMVWGLTGTKLFLDELEIEINIVVHDIKCSRNGLWCLSNALNGLMVLLLLCAGVWLFDAVYPVS